MSFDSTRALAAERLNEALVYLNHIQTCEPPPPQPGSLELKIMKGLFIVHLYGALEKITTEALQLLLRKICSIQPKNSDVALPFNVISMSKKWKSVKDSGYKDIFPRMTEFFLSIESQNFHGIEETLFADRLQNIWAKTFEDILGALGMTNGEFRLTASEIALIDELVDKRNAVAHGRESAASVGEKYQCEDLRRKHAHVLVLINNFIEQLDLYFQNRSFIQPALRAHYP